MPLGVLFRWFTQRHFAVPSVRVHGCQMVSKCSNPHCSASFLYLHIGKLFRFDTSGEPEMLGWDSPKRVKKAQFFWLCEACVKRFTLVTDAGVGARVISLPPRARSAAAGS